MSDHEPAHERTPLLLQVPNDRRLSAIQLQLDSAAHSIRSSAVTKEEDQLIGSPVGERLPYNDYTTIDHLHDLVSTTNFLLWIVI